ncbi:cytochrome P450 [Mycena sanguinolenta]|nr:cytochrome P450 [Mycena sanguinolenta]
MTGLPLQAVTVAAIALLGGVCFVWSRAVSSARRPPGPSGLPLLGNIFQAPVKPVFLIGDITLAKELLDKRSAKFSSRPTFPYVRYHVDPAQVYWAMSERNESHFIARRLTTGLMAAVRAGETDPLQQFEALLNVTHLLDDGGKNWFHHTNRVPASMVLAAAFGLHCPTGQEPDVKEIMACLVDLVSLCNPTASIINVVPLLDLIPGPMPWRRRAQTYRKREDALYDKLITRAISGEASGMNTWAAVFAGDDNPEGDQRRLMNQFTGDGFRPRLECTPLFLPAYSIPNGFLVCRGKSTPLLEKTVYLPSTIVLAFHMLKQLCEVWMSLRRLSDIVVTRTAETLRWRPAARFGVPHQSTVDDVVEYKGEEYFIPSGSIIFAVTWAMEHEQERFENPDLFQPERFLDDANNLKVEKDLNVLLPRHKEQYNSGIMV